MSYRIVICVDVEADDLAQAYGKVYRAMMAACEAPPVGIGPEDLAWESSDEAFDSDGGVVDPDDLQAARMAYFESEKYNY